MQDIMNFEPLTGDAKHTLQHLIANIDFVIKEDELKRYQCQCCKHVALLHHVAECRHIFCDKCLYKILCRSCPVQQCDNKNIEQLTHDETLEEEVNQLEMYCQFRKHGCEDTFPLRNYFAHQKTCQYIAEGLLSNSWQKPSLGQIRMDGQITNLDDAFKDVNARLCAMEESIEKIREKEKYYNEAFIVLKQIQNMLKDQGFKPKANSQGPSQDSESQCQVDENSKEKWLAPERTKEISGHIACADMIEVNDFIELKTSDLENDITSTMTNATKDEKGDINQNQSGHRFEALLTEQMPLVKEDLKNMQKSHLTNQYQDLTSKVEELANNNENTTQAVAKLREAAQEHNQAPLIAETEFKRYEDDLDMIKDAINALQESVSLIQSKAKLDDEGQKIINLKSEEKFQEWSEETFTDKGYWHGVNKKKAKDNSEKNIANEIQTRLEDLEKKNEHFKRELQEVKNNSEVINKTEECSNANQDLKSCCCKLSHQEVHGMQSGYTEFIWKLTGFSNILSNFQNNVLQEVESDIFLTSEPVYEMKARLMLYKDFLSIYLSFVQEENSKSKSVYYHKRTFVVLDQATVGIGRRDLVRSWEPSFGRKNVERWMKEFWGSLHFVPLALLDNGDRYVRNDTVLIKIVIEPLAMLYKALAATDGMLFWKMEDYSMLKEREASGLTQGIKSTYFYSSQKGYRMQMELCLNGHGEENQKHISAFIWFRRGPFDDFLPKKFAHRTTFCILDQSDCEEKLHLKKVVELDRIRNTIYSKLVLQSTIEDSRYLKNDALLIKVIVEPIEVLELVEKNEAVKQEVP